MADDKPKEPSGKAVFAVLVVLGAWAVTRFDLCAQRGTHSSPAPSAPQVKKVPPKELAAERAAAATAARPPTEREIAARLGEPYVEPVPVVYPALAGSRAAFRGWFQRLGVPFKDSPLADGTPRELGVTANKYVTVEAIGHGDQLEKATMMFGVQSDDASSVMLVTGALLVFMRETGWEGGQTWVIAEMKKGKGAKKIKGAVAYELTIPMPGIFILSAKPKGAN